MVDVASISTLDEIHVLLKELPGPDRAAAAKAEERQSQLTKPLGALGRLEELAIWLASWQGRAKPQIERPFTAVFAGNHGIAAKGVSAYPTEVTKQMVANFIHGGAAVNQLCGLADSDLRVYELSLDEPTADFSEAPAMPEDDFIRAMAYGMMAVEEGIDVLALGEMGIGNTTSAAAICTALYGGDAGDWVGRGTGVDDATLKLKKDLVNQAMELHQADFAKDPLQILRCVGGLELAAIAGAVIAARLARTPVLLDGYTCTAAAAVLHAIDPRLLDHCVVAHQSVEPGHVALMEKIGKQPLVNFNMRLGEGSGAVLAILLLKAACACHNGMATFAEAGVSGPAD
ncbi:nicotinate-nucleotide--dimethylbenzimidazole phosphoribosyltransferase [Kiloniella laminariae]|uniref:Nicotinate-nucleotide--dimethylbenzimidazole phosphoribosyltransferase n=1 Tax=Kiloniella laminariae TaxID=454162 RepID=A0ABT4LIM2_9PROT|nr:nicotinate-nucleotide--dimethylbenzimidazole phosphoribosyltransferase [Kiloniella laminariae]MCZ4280959.1 nicotinate-nucleotide--dimethylbenzimidazole phosphoribosyltransferase [Kiloniella laminariae]